MAGDDRSGSGADAHATLVLKVPPEKMDAMLDQLGRLGREQSRSSSTQDVTQDVADVDARVASMQASIARVRAILSRAERIGDVVSVEGELSRRTTDLESLQARQRALAGQVNYATITLQLDGRPRRRAGTAAGPGRLRRRPARRLARVRRDRSAGCSPCSARCCRSCSLAVPVAVACAALRRRRLTAAAECTSSTTRVSTAGSVSGSTPWPRLKTWPGAARPSASTRRTSASTTGQSASSSAGSRLPCTARPGPTRRAASSSGTRQSTPDHVRAGLAHQPEQLAGADAEVDPSARPRSASAANTAALCGCTNRA